MKVQVYVKKLSDICSLWKLSFMTMKVIIFYEKKFIKKSLLIRQDVFSLKQSYQLTYLS